MTSRIKSDNVQIGANFVLPIENPYKEEETKIKRMLMAAQKEKERLIQEGVNKAKELVEEAKQIIVQAQQDAENIVKTANEQANSDAITIKDTAQKEGYDAGYKQGYEDGTNSLEEKVLAIDTFAQCQFDLKHNIIRSAQLDIVELILAIANKVCHKTLDDDIEVLKSLTIESIKQLKDKESITITINPQLAEKIYSISDELKEAIPKLQNIRIIEDDNVSADGTIVESLLSRVDNRVKIQIDQISEKFMTTHYSAEEDNLDTIISDGEDLFEEVPNQNRVDILQIDSEIVSPQNIEGLSNDNDIQ